MVMREESMYPVECGCFCSAENVPSYDTPEPGASGKSGFAATSAPRWGPIGDKSGDDQIPSKSRDSEPSRYLHMVGRFNRLFVAIYRCKLGISSVVVHTINVYISSTGLSRHLLEETGLVAIQRIYDVAELFNRFQSGIVTFVSLGFFKHF